MTMHQATKTTIMMMIMITTTTTIIIIIIIIRGVGRCPKVRGTYTRTYKYVLYMCLRYLKKKERRANATHPHPPLRTPIMMMIIIIIMMMIIMMKGKGKEMFSLTTHSTHFIYGYIASDIW